MQEALFRAVAILTAKPGLESVLLDYTREVLPIVRTVEGLQKVELSRSLSNPAQLVLYYWWQSPEASSEYVNGEVYAAIGPKLAELVQHHVLVVSELFDC